MDRIARIVLIVYAIVILGLAALIGVVQARGEVVADQLTRHAEPRVLWGGGATDVTLSYAPPADLACPAVRRAANVLLLIDKSESMVEDDAFTAALAAAGAFIDATDLTISRAGVIFFDDLPLLTTPPTQDAAQLHASLTGYIPSGTTDTAAALLFATQVLADLPGQSANLPANIVLLTDGLPNDEAAALAAGQLLKDGNVRLITVGAGQADNRFLRVLASGPADHFEITDPSQLPALYANLAEQIRSAVAFDVVLVEQVNPDLTVSANSLAPAGLLDGNDITWNVASVTDEGASFTYQADVGGWGLRNVNAEPTTMNYMECVAGAVSTALPSGPLLLVLPPGWLLLLMGLLPLLGLFLMAFFRRKREVAPPPPPPPPPKPPPEPADLFPAWLTRLDQTRILSQSRPVDDDGELTPTLIIGVGPVGRVVLPQVAQALRARHGGELPAPVRLLQVDVQPQGSSGPPLTRPDYLAPGEWVLLEPDLNLVQRNLERDGNQLDHLKWYQDSAPSYERARGRMALFYDLMNGAGGSRLWPALSAGVAKLEAPRLRLVGSTFDDVSSGMLVDLARLVQIISRSAVDVELWLSLPVGQEWSTRLNNPRQKMRPADQVSRTLATLRELERFQRNAPTSFHFVGSNHVQTELYGESHMAVVQSLFLFEPPPGTADVIDHLSTMADALLAVLPKESQQAVHAQLNRSATRATTLTNSEGRGMASSLGAYAIRLPLEALYGALNWRLLHDLLYESQVGLLPAARLQDGGRYEAIDVATVDLSAEQMASLRESAEQFANAFGNFGQTNAFRTQLAKRVADLLNGEDAPTGRVQAHQRAGGLLRAQTWLQIVRTALLREGHTGASLTITALEEHLATWQQFLLDDLRPHVEGRFHAAQADLAALTGQSARKWVLPAGSDWAAYRDAVRPWTTGRPTTNAAGEPLLRAAARFGWYVNYNEVAQDWQVALLGPPGDFVWQPEGVVPETHTLPRDPARLATRLYDIVRPAVASALKVEPGSVLDELSRLVDADVKAWRAHAEPRLKIDDVQASTYLNGSISEGDILVAPRSEMARQLQKKLTTGPEQRAVTLIESDDPTAVTLLRVRDRRPLYTLTNYGDEAWERTSVLPSLYVWPGEQAAAELETGDKRLSAIFVGWLERDRPLLDRFARAYLFGVFEHHRADRIAYLPGLNEWAAPTLGEALDNLMGGDTVNRPTPLRRPRDREQAFTILDETLDERRRELWHTPGRSAFVRDATSEGGLIDRLLRSNERREQDLGLYLQALTDQL